MYGSFGRTCLGSYFREKLKRNPRNLFSSNVFSATTTQRTHRSVESPHRPGAPSSPPLPLSITLRMIIRRVSPFPSSPHLSERTKTLRLVLGVMSPAYSANSSLRANVLCFNQTAKWQSKQTELETKCLLRTLNMNDFHFRTTEVHLAAASPWLC